MGRSTATQYLDLIAGGESDRARADMSVMSGCGLVVRGLWKRCGLCDPRLDAPYKVGSVIATIEEMAHEADAWRSAASIDHGVYMPDAGDVFMLDGPVHVATLMSTSPAAADPPHDFANVGFGDFGDASGRPWQWFSVDGGQRDAYSDEFIARRTRTCALHGSTLALDGRPLLGVVDIEALFAKFGASS
jgi:hypothetical protein